MQRCCEDIFTKGYYDGLVVDIYYNEETKVCWLEYSGQRNDTKVTALTCNIQNHTKNNYHD